MTGDAKDPLVTVICPTYNSRATLQYALRSVLNQDFADFEVRVMGEPAPTERKKSSSS